MQIVTVQFNHHFGQDYKLLLDVFKFSCEKHMPDAEFIEYKIDPPGKHQGIPYNFIYNDVKLKIWRDHMRQTDQNVIFADCDMLCTGDASSAFETDFDIAYTKRTTTTRIPMNGGIVFAKPTKETIQFFDLWFETDNRMLECDKRGNRGLHSKYRAKWAGMNQASFGWMMEHKDKYETKIREFLTKNWNAVDCDWAKLNEKSDVKFIHYKSRLRKVVLENIKPTATFGYCKKVWYDILREMKLEDPAELKIVPERARPLTVKKYKGRYKVKGR